MKVRMISLAAGPAGVWEPGAIVDLPAAQADELAAAGYASYIDRQQETTTFSAREMEAADFEVVSRRRRKAKT